MPGLQFDLVLAIHVLYQPPAVRQVGLCRAAAPRLGFLLVGGRGPLPRGAAGGASRLGKLLGMVMRGGVPASAAAAE